MKETNVVKGAASDSSSDATKETDCFFIAGMKADGKPYSYGLHKYLGISGGTGPMGSIESKGVNIVIPRSKKALTIHRIGFLIKAISLVISIIVFKPELLPNQGFITKISISLCILLLGGLVTLLFYQTNKTRSKFFFAGSYPVIKEYKKKGYKRGAHPMMSTTPVGIIVWFFRLLF